MPLWSPTFILFFRNTLEHFISLNLSRVVFLSNISANVWSTIENNYRYIAGDCPKVKILFSLKQWKVDDIVFTQNSFCDQDKTLPELKLRYHPETKIWRQFSPLTMGRYLKLNSLYGVCCYFFINVTQSDV